MLSRHDAAVRSPLLAARGRLRWRLCDVLECGAVFVMVITQKLSSGGPRHGERPKEPTGNLNS
jgi:hypothetical protein